MYDANTASGLRFLPDVAASHRKERERERARHHHKHRHSLPNACSISGVDSFVVTVVIGHPAAKPTTSSFSHPLRHPQRPCHVARSLCSPTCCPASGIRTKTTESGSERENDDVWRVGDVAERHHTDHDPDNNASGGWQRKYGIHGTVFVHEQTKRKMLCALNQHTNNISSSRMRKG